MIWCRYVLDGETHFGQVEGDSLVRVAGSPFGDHKVLRQRDRLAEVRLLVPVIPGTFYCAGANYVGHIVNSARRLGKEPVIPAKPDIGYRAASALIAHEENIVKPADSGAEFQYEGELVAVIGKKAKHLSREAALDCVFGWTIGNDVSERTWQRQDRTFWRAKNADTFKPMGPWIVTGLDPDDMHTTVRLNGCVTDSFATADMIFDAATFISEVTKYVTLYAGDVMWLGTDGDPRNMQVGDTVEIDISGIGVLRNRIVADSERAGSGQ